MSSRMHIVTVTLLCLAWIPAAGAGGKEERAMAATRAGEHELAASLWAALAEKGDSNAQFRLGTLYMQGRGVPKNETEGERWYRLAAEAGLPQAKTQLALFYLSGRGHPEDDPNAELYLRETAQTAPGKSQYELGTMYMDGKGIPRNALEALYWFERAGDNWGRDGARAMVSRMRDDGILHRVAGLGYAEAQFFLGELYADGNGVPKSLEEAARWHFLAANQGHAEAQMTIAWYYGRGIGVTKDAAESLRWFRKAAEQGHVQGQYQLGLMLRDGVGCKIDKTEAHMWFNVAAAQGHTQAAGARDDLIQRMTREEKTEAEARAVAWWLAHVDEKGD